MAALNFPANPTDGDIYEGYVWVDAIGAWQINDQTAKIINTDGEVGQKIYVGSVDPVSGYTLFAGDIWIEVP
jgi:hypothetical protein